MPAGRVAAQEEMSAELVRKVAVVPLEEIRLCGRETDAVDSAKDRRSDGGG